MDVDVDININLNMGEIISSNSHIKWMSLLSLFVFAIGARLCVYHLIQLRISVSKKR